MVSESQERQVNQTDEQIRKLQEFLAQVKDVKEWKRGETARLRLLSFSYQEIAERLTVSISFIAQTLRKYREQGIEGLKLQYKGSRAYLSSAQKEQIIGWLKEEPQRQNVSELERYIMATYDVVFKSRQSYYEILKEARLSWQKANSKNPRKKPELIKKRLEEIEKVIEKNREAIEAGEVVRNAPPRAAWNLIPGGSAVVYALDECHLQGDDPRGYVWGDRKERGEVVVPNSRSRQTYYGALNLKTQEFIVSSHETGNGENTVKFLDKLTQCHRPEQRIFLF